MKKTRKPYQFDEDELMSVNEPIVAYETPMSSSSHPVIPHPAPDKWNPNVPFHCTQGEFLEHIRSIEQSIERGEFLTAEESKRRSEEWKRNFLASRI
ncbi:MAG: hypothetical protein LBH22_05420 [Bacteroidales bacterium]|jgi:hypothetical protein|nr:hypothetical protein [Bacteroidales bacterium]